MTREYRGRPFTTWEAERRYSRWQEEQRERKLRRLRALWRRRRRRARILRRAAVLAVVCILGAAILFLIRFSGIIGDVLPVSAHGVGDISTTADTEEPVIDGVAPLSAFIGEAIAYKAGITVTDNRDEEVELVKFLNVHRINTVCWVVSALTMISATGTQEKCVPRYLRIVAFGSEIFPLEQFRLWWVALPETDFFNLYGSTETTGMSCVYHVNREIAAVTE